MNILKNCVLFNDTTSQLNWGCHATSYFTKKIIKENNFNLVNILTLHDSMKKNKFNEFIEYINKNNIEFVFVNGEGSLYEQKCIKGTCMLIFIKLMKKYNKTTYLLNSCFDLISENNILLFRECLFDNLIIQLREPVSIENFNKNYEKIIYFQPDFLLTINKNDFSNDFSNDCLKKLDLKSKDYIVIGGNSNYYRSDREPYDAIENYCNLINIIKLNLYKKIIIYASSEEEIEWLTKISIKENCNIISVANIDWKEAFVILTNAYISISGRYHPTLMSLIGGVPSLCISANHCKMNGIHKMFELPFDVIDSHKIHLNHDNIIQFIEKLKNEHYYSMVHKNIITKYIELKKKCIINKLV